MQPPLSNRNTCRIKQDITLSAQKNITDTHVITTSPWWKNNIATLQAMVGAKPTIPINKIHERPTFSTLWHIQHSIGDGIHKIGKIKFPLDGHAGYILLKEAFFLLLRKEWKDPENSASITRYLSPQLKKKNRKPKKEVEG